jgi:dihydroorotase
VDIVILDPEKEWEVDVKRFASKGENTPLNGTRLKGKVMATLPKGQIAYKDDSLDIHRANFNDKRVNE